MPTSYRDEIFNVDFKPVLWLAPYLGTATTQTTSLGTVSGSAGTNVLTTSVDFTADLAVGQHIWLLNSIYYVVETINATTITTTTNLLANYGHVSADKIGISALANSGSRADIGLTQGDPIEQPFLSESDSDFNNYDVIDFHNSLLFATPFSSLLAPINKSWSLSMVFKHTGVNVDGLIFSADSDGSSYNERVFAEFNPATGTSLRAYRGLAGTATVITYGTIDTDAHIAHFVFHGATETMDIWRDGVKIITGASCPAATRLRLASLHFGGYYDTGVLAFPAQAKLATAMLHDFAVTDNEINKVNDVLLAQYGCYTPATRVVVDVFFVAGQSNAQGIGNSALSTLPYVGLMADGPFILQIKDPVGTANTGSAWPAFANYWYSKNGRMPIMNNAATVGATALLAAADGGAGNWSPTGSLRAAAITNWNQTLAAIAATDYLAVGSVYVLWAQGEREGQNINGTTITGDLYRQGLVELGKYFYENLTTPYETMGIFELGAKNDGTDEADFAEIRTAQADAAMGTQTEFSQLLGTATGTLGKNELTTSADFTSNLAVGELIKVGGSNEYQIRTISATTITIETELEADYVSSNLEKITYCDFDIKMLSTIQKSFPADGLMGDNVHYSQAGYNKMGVEGAKNL